MIDLKNQFLSLLCFFKMMAQVQDSFTQRTKNGNDILFYLFGFLCLLWNRVSLYSPSWPGTCSDPSAFQVLGLQKHEPALRAALSNIKKCHFKREKCHFKMYSSFLKINVILLFSEQAFKIWYILPLTACLSWMRHLPRAWQPWG